MAKIVAKLEKIIALLQGVIDDLNADAAKADKKSKKKEAKAAKAADKALKSAAAGKARKDKKAKKPKATKKNGAKAKGKAPIATESIPPL